MPVYPRAAVSHRAQGVLPVSSEAWGMSEWAEGASANRDVLRAVGDHSRACYPTREYAQVCK